MPNEGSAKQATRLLQRLCAGDAQAGDDLLPLIHGELRTLAQQFMRGERKGHTLQPTALVHEAWLRLIDVQLDEPVDRTRFLQLAARAMRNVLVDHARERNARKRGGDRHRVELDDALSFWEQSQLDLLDLNEALDKLGAMDPQLVRIVELRFFAGLTLDETAEALELTVPQVRWSWGLARGWMRRELQVVAGG